MNDTKMTTMNDVTEIELAAIEGGNPIVNWFLTNLVYGIMDSLAGDPPGCNSVSSCYALGRA